MTDLRINLIEYKSLCKSIRDDIKFFNADEESIYSYYRWFVRDHGDKLINKSTANPADDLRAELNIAARAMQEHGATKAQIDYIVALAVKKNDFNVLGSAGRLSRAEASRIIDTMK